ncbi:MAG TPA: hypothetical protein VI583_06630 [Cyclobacteriaceae bacterium]|nr:hypothetical protein [Cyclobacteriaceae bacterium]
MKTPSYNPSPIEVELTGILKTLIGAINGLLKNKQITESEIDLNSDNPAFRLTIRDDDGDIHTVVMKIIQKPDGD